MAITFVSLAQSSSGAIAGAAPDVQSFQAGTRQPDGSYVAAMSLDAMGANLVVAIKAVAPTTRTNFNGIKIAIIPPDSAIPQIATPLLEPFAPDDAGNYVYEGLLTIDPAILGGSIPPNPVSLTFIAASVNSSDVMNVDGNGYPTGPSVMLTTLNPVGGVPIQPASFTASLIATGYNEAAGQPLAEIQVSVPTSVLVKYYSVWQYAGVSAPTDPSDWGSPVLNYFAIGATSPTTGEWWTARSFSSAITLWIRVRASSVNYTASVSDSGPADVSVVIPQVGAPAQPTGFTVTLQTRSTASGISEGALVCSWTPPADVEYFAGKVYAIDTDASYTPLSGATWRTIGNGVSGFSQSALNPPQWWTMGNEGWLKLKVQSVGRAIDPATGENIENAVSAPTVNLHVTASPGIDTSKLATPVQGSQLASGIIDSLSYFGSSTLRPLVVVSSLPTLPNANYPVGSMVVNSTDGKPYRNVSGAWQAGTAAGDITAGTMVAGVVYAGAVAVSQLTAGTATFTSDVLFYRSASNYVGINSTGVNIVGSGNQLALTSAGILIQQNGSSGPYVQITSTSVSMVSQAGPVVSVGASSVSLQNVATGGSLTIQSSGITIQQGSGGGIVTLTSSGLTMKGAASGSYNNISIDSGGVATFYDNSGNYTIIGGSGSYNIYANGPIVATGTLTASGLIVGGHAGATENVDVLVPGGGTWRLKFNGGSYYGHDVIA